MWRQWTYSRQLKLNLLRFLRIRATPDDIAKGFALGVFIGMSPTFGLQMILAILLAMLLKENKIAAAIGVWITNPITAPLIYALEYETGRLLLGMEHARLPREFTFDALMSLSWKVIGPLGLGSLIYGILCAGVSYALVLRLIPIVKTWHIPRWPRPRKKGKKN